MRISDWISDVCSSDLPGWLLFDLGLRNRRRRLAERRLGLGGRLGHLGHAPRRATFEGTAALDLNRDRFGAAVAEALADLAGLDRLLQLQLARSAQLQRLLGF